MPKTFYLPEPLAWLAGLAVAATLALPLVLAENSLNQTMERPEAQPGPVQTALIQPLAAGPGEGPLTGRPAVPPLPSAAEEAADLPSPPIWPDAWAGRPAPALVTAVTLIPAPGLLDDLRRRIQPQAFSSAAAAYEDIIETAASEHQVSPLLIKAVIQAESRFNPLAVSHKGAVGLMQILPSTARDLGVYDLRDPKLNVEVGVKYLKTLLVAFDDDEHLALAAYNCGAEAMKRFNNEIPPFPETRNYVNRVMAHYSQHLEN